MMVRWGRGENMREEKERKTMRRERKTSMTWIRYSSCRIVSYVEMSLLPSENLKISSNILQKYAQLLIISWLLFRRAKIPLAHRAL